jgi:hypothetical protein
MKFEYWQFAISENWDICPNTWIDSELPLANGGFQLLGASPQDFWWSSALERFIARISGRSAGPVTQLADLTHYTCK